MVVKLFWRAAYALFRFFSDIPVFCKWAWRSFRDATWRQCLAYFWQRAPWALVAVFIYYLVSPELANLWRLNQDLAWLNPGIGNHDMAKRLYTLHLHILVGLYACIAAAKSKVLLEAMAWWYLAIVETLEVVVFGTCKVVADKHTAEAMARIWELEGQTSSCDRLGGSLFKYGILPLTMIVMTYLVIRAFQVWRRTNPKAGNTS